MVASLKPLAEAISQALREHMGVFVRVCVDRSTGSVNNVTADVDALLVRMSVPHGSATKEVEQRARRGPAGSSACEYVILPM